MVSIFTILLAVGISVQDSTGNNQSTMLHRHLSESIPFQSFNPPREPHYLQVVATYEPGPGPAMFGQYVYSGFPSGSTSAILGWRSRLFGSFSYAHRIELDLLARKQITITPGVFSDYEPNRLFDGVIANERRTGGAIHTAFDYRFPDRHRFVQHLEVQHAMVWIEPNDGPASLTDLTTVETGSRIIRTTFFGLLPADILIEGRILGGRDHKNEESYSKVRLGSRWHQTLSSGFALNTELHGEWVSSNVPLFERPSLGGSLSVRGFRQDAVLGRTHLTVQHEIWIPIPGTMRSMDGFGDILRRHVRFAAFVDAAGIGRTDNPDHTGIRTGAGLGLRIRLGSLTLRADWGHRITDITDGDFGGNFFLSIRPDYFILF